MESKPNEAPTRSCFAFASAGRALAAATVLFLLAAASAAPAAQTRNFDVPAGGAEESLRAFARQAGVGIMVLADSLAGVRTGSVKGAFTVEQALTRMLEGTGLEGARDGPSGAVAIVRGRTEDPVVRLPPYFVRESAHPIRWRYAAIPGFEILASCRDAQIEEFAYEIHRQKAWLDQLVPPGLQSEATLPTTLIVFGDDERGALSGSLAELARQRGGQADGSPAGGGAAPPVPAPGLLTQVKLWDVDSTAVGLVLGYPAPGADGALRFDVDYVLFTLARRAPPLPSWFVEGVVRFYASRLPADREGSASGSAALGSGMRGYRLQMRLAAAQGGVNASGQRRLYPGQAFAPLGWLSPEATEWLRDHPSAPRGLLPLRELLLAEPPRDADPAARRRWAGGTDPDGRRLLAHAADPDSPWRREVWRAQTALFVRWALDDDSFARRHALWALASRASGGRADAAAFETCFGMTLAEADRQLADYLAQAVDRPFRFVPEVPLEFPFVEARDATRPEEARILGDWQRRELEFVEGSHPRFAPAYARQAGATFGRGCEERLDDPEFLAALGIYRGCVGDADGARSALEAAARAGSVRPRAYAELARLRLAQVLGSPAGPRGTLDRLQREAVLGPVRASRWLKPPLREAFAAAAAALEHSADPPAEADLALLGEGTGYFPHDAGLAGAYARLLARRQR